MSLFKSCRAIGICVISMTLPAVCMAKSATDTRLERLETIVSNQLSVDLLNQLDTMQQEVQMLRGIIEEQQNALQQLADKQDKLFTNLDSRIAPAPDAVVAEVSVENIATENIATENNLTTDNNINNNINNNEPELFPQTEPAQGT